MPGRVVVAGGGIAGIACARALVAAGVRVEVRDRGRVVGGRMASRWIDGRIVDSGASYLTVASPEFRAVVEDWTLRGVARAWTDRFHSYDPAGGLADAAPGPVRYGAARGVRSLVADLVARGRVQVRQQSPITMVTAGPTVDGERADFVVLAMPDPQAIRHLGSEFGAAREAVGGRAYTPALALLAGWPRRSWPAIDGVFVNDDPTLSWVCDDGRRRGDGAPVLVAHSTPEFAAGRLTDPGAAAGELAAAVRRVLSIADEPDWTHVQRWSFAKPVESHDEPFWLSDDGLGLAGDGWGRSKIETAWQSGDGIGRAIAARLT
ncbi:MAG: NAD(P)/FAD-dependent oxidoreductase [Frankia sp.]